MKYLPSSIVGWMCGAYLTNCALAMGQGVIDYNTFPLGARITYADGTPVPSHFRARLLAGRAGTPIADLTPQIPETNFRTGSFGAGYVNSVVVVVPGIAAGELAVVVMQTFDGRTWEQSTCRGQSLPIKIRLSGALGQPRIELYGLQSFHVYCHAEITVSLQSDHAQLTWPATNQQPYTVQASSNLASTNWVPLLTIVSTNATATFTDPISITNSAPRFYRVVSP